MRRLMNFLRGMATLRVEGPFPERLMNLCAQEGVDFWGVSWLDGHTLRLTTRRETLSRLRKLAQRAGCEVQVEGSRGLPDFLLRFRRRYAFLVGLTLSLCAVLLLSRFVLTVEVKGNERVPTAVILSQLRQLGVRPGVWGPGLDRNQLAQEAVTKLEDVAWMGINLHGTRLEVIVREETNAPKRVDEGGYFDIVAEADGIITQVEAEQGQAAVREGDTVLAGEVVISGIVSIEPPKHHDIPVQYYQTHARGRVWARTWRTLTAAIPMEVQVKDYTGAETRRWSLELMGRRVELFGKRPGWERYDQTSAVHRAVLPGETALPIALTREEFREYRTKAAALDLGAAQTMLEGRLAGRLAALVGEDGTVESTQFTAKVEDGLLKVTLQAECLEEIGKEVPGLAPLPREERSEERETS